MAQIDNRGDVAAFQFGEREVGELPIELVGPEIGLVDRGAVAKIIDPDLIDAVEVLAPPFIVAADLHLVDSGLAMIDRRDAVLDPGREHEVGDRSVSLGLPCRSDACRVSPRAAIASPAKKKNLWTQVAFTRFSAMGSKSMHWADGFIAVDWGTTNRRAYLIDGDRPARRRIRGSQGDSFGAAGRLSRGDRRDPPAARRQAVAACRNGRLEPRLERGALRALPSGDRRPRACARPAGRARGDRSRRVLRRRRPRRRHARRGGAAARRGGRRAGRARGARLPSRHAQQMGGAAPAGGSRASAPS